VLLNLAENAVKYTQPGGVITMGLRHAADGLPLEGVQMEGAGLLGVRTPAVQVYVQDSGIGISEEQQQLIFERFYRTDKARSRELGGSGLGLSIAQSITQAHNGAITVESKLGVGSTFSLWLPLAVEPIGDGR
jgi:signal transduction histidine kinase